MSEIKFLLSSVKTLKSFSIKKKKKRISLIELKNIFYSKTTA